MKSKDLTRYVPSMYVSVFPKLAMTESAQRVIESAAKAVGLTDDLTEVYQSIASSAGSFRNSVYFAYSKWFNSHQHHPIRAARFETGDGAIVEPVLMLDWKNGVILAEDEVRLPDDYCVTRLLEIMRVDRLTGVSSDVT